MKLKSIYNLFFPVLLGIAVSAKAQDPMLFYYMETIPQSNRVNPALQPRANAFLMGPALRFNLNSDLAVKDILQQKGDQWYSPVEKDFDFDKFRKAVGKKSTMFNTSAEVDFFGFGFRTAKGYFTFELSEHVVAQTAVPTDFFNIIDEGFPEGSTYDFSPLRAKGMSYMQILVGYSRAINDKLTIGVNLKPILGQVAFTTDIKKFTLNTNSKQWNVGVEGNIYSSYPIEPLDEYSSKNSDDDFPDIKMQDLETGDYIRKYLSLKNPGIAVDLGATYKINERIEVSAALNNLGFIHWGQDLNGMAFNGNYAFNGINYDVTDDEKAVDDLVDSLKNSIDYRTHHKKFNTSLAPVLYVGGKYRLTEAISVGLLSRSTFWKKGFRQNFNLSLNLQPYSFVAFTIGVNQQIKGNTYLGAGFSINAGPFQFYLISDYIPLRYSTLTLDDGDKIPFIPERQKEVVIRTGFNILFGQHGYQNRPMLDKRGSSWN
ncbi:hypothetical protein FACS189464_1140 [Bacteroidia bacterium]|nr:hypothetical protein FACS189464_1140 [Bacteroidia bacterium]